MRLATLPPYNMLAESASRQKRRKNLLDVWLLRKHLEQSQFALLDLMLALGNIFSKQLALLLFVRFGLEVDRAVAWFICLGYFALKLLLCVGPARWYGLRMS